MELTMAVILLLPYFLSSAVHGSSSTNQSATYAGDFVLGFLLGVHEAVPKSSCGAIRESEGIQRIEAAFQALDEVNQNSSLLPNITLGMKILDTCFLVTKSAELANDFVQNREQDNIIAVMGPDTANQYIKAQSILQKAKLPQIDYSEPASILSSNSTFYSVRIIPSNEYLVRALIDICLKYNWTTVNVVYTITVNGNDLKSDFTVLAKKKSIAIESIIGVKYLTSDSDADKALGGLASSPSSIIIALSGPDSVIRIFKSMKRLNLVGKYTVLSSDGWSDTTVSSVASIAVGSLTVRIPYQWDNAFENMFLSLDPYANTRNPWFGEFWEQHFNCTLNGTSSSDDTCTGKEDLSQGFVENRKIEFVKRAVYAMANALHNLQKDVCQDKPGVCPALKSAVNSKLMDYIRNVTFPWKSMMISLDSLGDLEAVYDVVNYQRMNNGDYSYIKIGSWSKEGLQITGDVQWLNMSTATPTDVSSIVPESTKVSQVTSSTKKPH